MNGGEVALLVVVGVIILFGILPIIAWLKELKGRKEK